MGQMAMTLDEQVDQVNTALGHFLNAQFTLAYEIINPLAEQDYPIHNLGKSFLLFLKTLFTFDPEDIQFTLDQIDRTREIAGKIRASQKKSLYDRVSFNAKKSMSHEDNRMLCHAELIFAETTLMRAVLLLVTDDHEGWSLMLKQSYHIRSSYGFYYRALDSGECKHDSQYQSGVLLGNGLFNLIFPLLPPKVERVFALFGYQGNTALGLEQLQQSTSLKGSLRGPISALLILVYQLIIAVTLPTKVRVSDEQKLEPEWLSVCEMIVNENLGKYPSSVIFRYFYGRLLIARKCLPEAIRVLEEGCQVDLEWPQLRHAAYWELCLCAIYTLDWSRGYRYASKMAKENKWSVAFYCYLEAVFLHSMDPSKADEWKALLAKIPSLMKRVAGRSIPVEKFALHRANLVLHEQRAPFHPALELALVWGGLDIVSVHDRKKIEEMMLEATCDDNERQSQVLLTMSNLCRLKGDPSMALLYATKALDLDTPSDSYNKPLGHLERAESYLQLGNVSQAEMEYQCSCSYKHGYLVKKFLQVRQSRLKIELDLSKKE